MLIDGPLAIIILLLNIMKTRTFHFPYYMECFEGLKGYPALGCLLLKNTNKGGK